MSTDWVITRHVARSALRWSGIWGAVFGLFVISTSQAFAVAYPTLDERIRAIPSLQSFSILLGQPYHAETVAGFTQWRVLVVIALIGGVWGILTSTGLFRGDEEAGRWELLLARPTTKPRATAHALIGIGLAVAAMLAITAVFTVVAGRLPGARFGAGAALLFALTLVAGAAMFAAIGALTSQLGETRGQAATLASLTLGAAYLLRMVADSQSGLGWLRWLTRSDGSRSCTRSATRS